MRTPGLIRISVASIRREPDHKSEQMTQAILGTAVDILDQLQNWLSVRLPDGYTGWVNESSVHRGEKGFFRRWSDAPKVMISSPIALIFSGRKRTSIPVSDAVIGTELRLVGSGSGWTRVALPDERHGWVANRDLSDPGDVIHREGGSAQQILKTARSFMGFPYLWGGVTPKGFDCSGFVQTVFRLNGISLPRDAYQQHTCGQEVADQNGLSAADLLFFRARGADRIGHVALHIQRGQFIHCSGQVKINSLEQSACDYDASLGAQYAGAKRVLGGLAGQC